MDASHPFTVENEVFAAFLFYASIIFLKMLVVSPLTIFYRFATNSFMNVEDAVPLVGKPDPEKQKRALIPSERVSRIKRIHANDIENIIPFTILSLMYVTIGPDAAVAKALFQAFVCARIAHTFIYLFAVPQPSRFLAFLVGLFVNVYMAIQILCAAC